MDFLMEISITEELKESLANLGRTEDVKFSPDENRLALAGFIKNKILLINVAIEINGSIKQVTLTDFVEITSPELNQPHGLFFNSNEILVVANRGGNVLLFELPSRETSANEIELRPLVTIGSHPVHHIFSPGSVSVSQLGSDLHEVLICNNFAHYVTRHILDGRNQFRVISSAILIKKGMKIPDGIAMNKTNDWIAISNHSRKSIFLFENTSKLNSQSDPDGILGNIAYPHGLRFTSDGKFILVADAGAPFVHVFSKPDDAWVGEHDPLTSIRVLDDETFNKGQYNPQEGGPKGIDIDKNMKIFVTTSEHQKLAFFDLEKILIKLRSEFSITQRQNPDNNDQANADDERTILLRELERESYLHSIQEDTLKDNYKRELHTIHNSHSMKITAPFRWIRWKITAPFRWINN